MTHPLDVNLRLIDAHVLPEVGTEPGEDCNRWIEADENPFISKYQCGGTMRQECGEVVCDSCGVMV